MFSHLRFKSHWSQSAPLNLHCHGHLYTCIHGRGNQSDKTRTPWYFKKQRIQLISSSSRYSLAQFIIIIIIKQPKKSSCSLTNYCLKWKSMHWNLRNEERAGRGREPESALRPLKRVSPVEASGGLRRLFWCFHVFIVFGIVRSHIDCIREL